jgi:hypothetical protein
MDCDLKLVEFTVMAFAFAGTVNEKLPSMSVIVPWPDWFTRMLAPGMGLPFLSVTLPVTDRPWAATSKGRNKIPRTATRIALHFLMVNFGLI